MGKGRPNLTVRLSFEIQQGLQAYAKSKDTTKSSLVRRIIEDWLHSQVSVVRGVRGVHYTMTHLDALVKRLELSANPIYIAGGLVGAKQAKAGENRELLYDIALRIVKDAVQLAQNEAAAKAAGAQMCAMRVAIQGALAAEYILSHYEEGDIRALVDEVVKNNEVLKEKIRELEARTGEAAYTS
jgi:hypothetical protein